MRRAFPVPFPMTIPGIAAILALSLLTGNAWGRTFVVRPGDDYRPMVAQLQPGDVLVFMPGVHEQHAALEVTGSAEAPIIIRGQADADGRLPEIRWTGRGQNTWRVSGRHLQIRDLAFHSAHAYAMRVGSGAHITIEGCLFRDNGGGDLSANSGEIVSLHVLRSRFIGGRRTPVYIGNHSGTQVVRDFRFEGNVVDASQIQQRDVVGYGIQLKLNVDGVIRNNYISGSQGPAIMVYGFEKSDTAHRQRVENNITVGARHSANIVVGGGPVLVQRNLVLAGHQGGISAIDYGGRDLLHGVSLVGNIAAGNAGHGISVNSKTHAPVITGNRVYMPGPQPHLGSVPQSARLSDNAAEAINGDLARLVDQLRQREPASEAVQAAVQTLQSRPPASQAELTDLLQLLLRS